MSAIAIVNQKGGCTKTTTAIHLARWAALDGYNVALIDCDPQWSSSWWLEGLHIGRVDSFTSSSADDLIERLPDINEQYDLVIIDGPAGLSEMTRAILLRCDLALVPTLPTGLDVKSTVETIRLIKQAQSVRGDGPRGALFLARAIERTRLKRESIDVLTGLDVPLLNSVIHTRQAVADSFGQHSTVFDMAGRPAATSAIEFHDLFREAVREWLPVQSHA